MSEKNAQWVSLAARVVRVALMRKDVGYAELTRKLAAFGVQEEDRALASRVALGRVRLELFLQILHVIDAELPVRAQTSLMSTADWKRAYKK